MLFNLAVVKSNESSYDSLFRLTANTPDVHQFGDYSAITAPIVFHWVMLCSSCNGLLVFGWAGCGSGVSLYSSKVDAVGSILIFF